MKAVQLVAVAVVACSLYSCASRAIPRTLPPINGMIYDYDNVPVAAASVSVDGFAVTQSDVNGRFALSDFLPGRYAVAARKDGYEPVELTVDYDDPTQILYLKMFSVDQLLSLAEKSFERRDWRATEELLLRAERIKPDSAPLRYLRAALRYRRGDAEGARSALDALLADGDNDPYVHVFLADLYQYRLGDEAEALRHLDAFLNLRYDPEIEKRRDELKSRSRH